MNTWKSPTVPLITVAVAIVGVSAIQLVRSPTVLGIGAVAGAVLIAWLLVRQNRIAWTLAVLAAGAQLATLAARGEFGLPTIADIVILLCLLLPPVVKGVWRDRNETRSSLAMSTASTFNTSKQIPGSLLLRARSWSNHVLGGNAGEAAWRLGAAAVILLVPLTIIHNWDQNSDSAAVEVIANAMWVFWAFVVLGFIGVLLFAMVRYVTVIYGRGSAPKRK